MKESELDQFIKAVEEEYERTLQLALKNSNESWEVRLNTSPIINPCLRNP